MREDSGKVSSSAVALTPKISHLHTRVHRCVENLYFLVSTGRLSCFSISVKISRIHPAIPATATAPAPLITANSTFSLSHLTFT